MPKRNVASTDRQAKFVELVEGSGAQNAAKLEALRTAAQVGIDAMERGDYVTFSDEKSLNSYFGDVREKVIERRTAS